MVTPTADAELAARLVTAAGQLAMRMRGADLHIDTKGHVSDLVTDADRAAERMIVETLALERPADGVLGEEGATRPSSSGRTWVIDPVDGTNNFVAGLPNWCSALALRGDATGDGIVGAVHVPVSGDTYVGGPPGPATCNGVALPALADRPLRELSVASYLHPPNVHDQNRLDPWLAVLRGAATLRVLGSGSVDLSWVAAGRVGLFIQCGCPEWDWLPGATIVRSVGGHAVSVDHRGLTWYVAGPPTAVREAVALLLAAG